MRINLIGDFMNINLGTPYEVAIEKIMQKGYAGSQTEVIRQAILAYERMIDEEEVMLVNKGIADEMEKMNFSNPEDGAEIVKLRDVDVAEEKYDRPCATRTAPDEEINSTADLRTICATPDASTMNAPKPFLSTIAPVAFMAMRRP